MIDEQAAASVTSTDVPVAIDPSQLNKPQMPDTQTGNGDELLKHKLGLANKHAKDAKLEADEAKKQLTALQQEMQALKEAQQSAVQKNLEDQGAFRELYEQEKSRAKQLEARLLSETSELKAQLESVTQGAAQERLKTSALGQISQAGAINPSQLLTLLQPGLRTNDEGQPVFLNGGVEQNLGDYLAHLKQATEWGHHFSASNSKGMGAAPGAQSVAPGMENPYKTKNFTAALMLERDNPELAKTLKQEAIRAA